MSEGVSEGVKTGLVERLSPLKILKDRLIESKSKVKILGNIENKLCSAI